MSTGTTPTGTSSELVPVVIATEQDAWELLERAVQKERLPENLLLKFDGWPKYKVKISGRDWHGTVPTRIMPAILDLQKDLHRVYAEVRYGEPNIRRLSKHERELLEIVVEVEKGSSEFQAALENLFTVIAREALGKMPPDMIAITVLGSALILGSTVVGKAWIAKQQRDKELETQLALNQEESRRLDIVAKAVQQKPYLEDVKTYVEDHTNRVLRALQPQDQVHVMGASLTGRDSSKIVEEARATAEETHYTGLFRVHLINTEQSRLTRIKVSKVDSSLELMADLPPELPFAQEMMIFDAARDRALVLLHVTATLRRGNISEAFIASVSAAPSNPD